jgi:hypothetical protein
MSSSKKSKGDGKGKDNKGKDNKSKDKGKGKKTSDDTPANFNTLQRPTKPRAAKKVLIVDKKDDELPTYDPLQRPSDTAFPYTACGEVVKKVPKVPTYAICKFTAFISNFLQSFSSC